MTDQRSSPVTTDAAIRQEIAEKIELSISTHGSVTIFEKYAQIIVAALRASQPAAPGLRQQISDAISGDLGFDASPLYAGLDKLVSRNDLDAFAWRVLKLATDRLEIAYLQPATPGCICQDQHRRGYCTEPGCSLATPTGGEAELPEVDQTPLREAKKAAMEKLYGTGSPSSAGSVKAAVKTLIGDEEAVGKTAVRLLNLWTEIKGAEDQPPYHETMALLGKPNSSGWVWAREVREERDFDAERNRHRDLALECIRQAEEESGRLRALLGAAQPATHPADEMIGQIEARFPDWKSFRDLVDCIDVTLHRLRGGQ